jgi:hypothetical protein
MLGEDVERVTAHLKQLYSRPYAIGKNCCFFFID